ncbi:MAG TPA: hypothetical protein PLC99_14370 [Verrucomicrobiota bacterium]|nr:hypothetical protein [Verrucomicrobiota bacterium]
MLHPPFTWARRLDSVAQYSTAPRQLVQQLFEEPHALDSISQTGHRALPSSRGLVLVELHGLPTTHATAHELWVHFTQA